MFLLAGNSFPRKLEPLGWDLWTGGGGGGGDAPVRLSFIVDYLATYSYPNSLSEALGSSPLAFALPPAIQGLYIAPYTGP